MDTNKISLRVATTDDVDEISSLILQNFNLMNCSDSRERIYMESNLPKNLLKNHFASESVSVIVAEIGQRLIGCLVYDLENVDVMHLRKCHVVPDFRKQGVSLALFKKAISEARDAGANSFFSKITASDRESLIIQ